MPTIEFFGYSGEEMHSMVALARQVFSDLPFTDAIVFVLREPGKVIAWDGKESPFVRISTRSPERAQLLKSRLHAHADVEIVFIDFHPRRVLEE